MDAGAAAPDGGPHGWLSGGHHDGGGGFPLCAVLPLEGIVEELRCTRA